MDHYKDKSLLKEILEADRKANLNKQIITAEMRFQCGFPYSVYRYLILLRQTESLNQNAIVNRWMVIT